MLTEGLLEVGKWVLNAILDVLDVLPSLPASVTDAVQTYFNLIFGNINVLGFFFPISFAVTFVALAIAVENFEHIYSFIMWILRKIPFVGVE